MVKTNLTLIVELAKRDLREKYAGSVLGLWWNILWPVVLLFIYVVVFGEVMGMRLAGKENFRTLYGIYLASGLFPWMAFANILSRTTSIFLDRRHFLQKLSLRLEDLILYVVVSESLTFIINYGIFILVWVFMGGKPSANLIWVPVWYYFLVVLSCSLGTILATLTVFLRDLKEVTNIALQLWFWFTPIVYMKEVLPSGFQKWIGYNPVYPAIEALQQIFVRGSCNFSLSMVLYFIVIHLILGLSFFFLKKMEKDIRDFL